MLLSAVSFALLLTAQIANSLDACPLAGQSVPTVEGSNNYVIDKFQSLLPFTYAIDKCTANTVVANGLWYKYLCLKNGNDWRVTKYSYTDSNCVTDETAVTSWNQGQSAAGMEGYFYCDGDNSYVELEVSLNTNCATTQIVYAGLGGCFYSEVPTKFYCDNHQALAELFASNRIATTTSPTTTSARRLLIATTDIATTTDLATTGLATTTDFATTADLATTDIASTVITTNEAETTEMDTTGPEVYTTEPEVDTTEPEVDTTEPEVDTTEFEVDTTEIEPTDITGFETSEYESSEQETSEIESTVPATTTPATTTTESTTTTALVPEYCSNDLYCDNWTFGESCAQVLTFTPPGGDSVPVFGKFVKCVIGPETTAVTKGASSFFVMINLIVAIFALLF